MKLALLLYSIILLILPLKIRSQIGIACKGCDSSLTRTSKVIIADSLPLSIRINGSEGGYVDSSSLASWNILKVFFKSSGNIDSLNYKILSYSCIVQGSTGAKFFNHLGATIDNGILVAINFCKKGDLIIFYNIKVSDEKEIEKIVLSGPVFRIQK